MSLQEPAIPAPWPGWPRWDRLRELYVQMLVHPRYTETIQGMIELVDVLRTDPAMEHVEPATSHFSLTVHKFLGQLQQPALSWVAPGVYEVSLLLHIPPQDLLATLRSGIDHLSQIDYSLPENHPVVDAATWGEFHNVMGWPAITRHYLEKAADDEDKRTGARDIYGFLPEIQRLAQTAGVVANIHREYLVLRVPDKARLIRISYFIDGFHVTKAAFIPVDKAAAAIQDFLSRVDY